MNLLADNMESPRDCSESGSALIELIIIAPVMFFIFFVSFEFSRVISNEIKLSYHSRETAKTAFRECSSDLAAGAAATPADFTALQTCIQVRAADIGRNMAEQVYPDVRVIVSVYEAPLLDPATGARGAAVLRATAEAIGGSGVTVTDPDLLITTAKVQSSYQVAVEGTGSLFVAEFLTPYTPVLSTYQQLFARLGDAYYAVTML